MQCDVAETGCRYFDTGGIIAGSAGTFSTTAALRRRVASWDGDPVDCAVDACVLIASAWSGGSYDKVSAPVSFDPSAPLPPLPTLAVDPSTDLVDHDAVTVTGDGWTPGDWVYVHQCADFGDDYGNCYYSSERYVEVGPDGTFTTEMRLRRMVPRNQWDPGAERFDCASAPGACRIEAVNYDDLIERASTDLVFDPDAPPAPPPTLTVEPATGLADLQVVQVHGEGFLPDDEVMLQQCSAGSDPWGYSGSCRGFEYTAAGDDGTFDMEVVVRRMVGSLATAATDCAVDECVMVARTWWDPYDGATAALGFDPSIPFRTPTVTVTPNVGLEDGQTVTVRGAGFSPNASIGMAQCGGNAASPYDCDLATVAYTNADSGGTFTREFEVSASVANGGAGGDRDCTAPGACVVGAANMSDFGEAGRDWLTFGAPRSSTPDRSRSTKATTARRPRWSP
ncbi:MAG: neocarzinostatin apoprotein domain-containing protein [Acidimicrobiia bacterium]|nr:neocarzinostatin apoprotein domain-containing protein [Acidimicrobiia bacterium]